MTLLQKQPKGSKNEMEVNLSAKTDQKTLLSLSYLSNSMLQNLVMDSSVCYVLQKHLNEGSSEKLSLQVEVIQ